MFTVFIVAAIIQVGNGQEKDPRCPLYNERWVVYVPHEYDCSLFYKCDWGVPILFECEPGLHFSEFTERCEYPKVANCKFQETSTNPPTTLQLSTAQSPTISFPVGSRCPVDDDPFNSPIFLSHEYDCSLFYMCFYGDVILYECSLPFHWSVELNRCDTPEIADCQLDLTPLELTTSRTLQFTSTSSLPTYPPRDPRCPLVEDPDNPVHLPHEYDCNLFYRCDNGKLWLEQCPGGIHWR